MKGHLTIRKNSFVLLSIYLFSAIAEIVSQDIADETYGECDPPYFGSKEPKAVPDGLESMGVNSKYFIVREEDSNLPIKDVAAFCETMGLQPAEIRSSLELMSIESYIEANQLDDITISLGINDEVKEGLFVEFDGTPMKFHVFAEGQPNNEMNVESCVAVTRHPVFDRMVYMDVTCDSIVTPVCMFRTQDKCYFSSPLSLAVSPSGFSYVGSSTARDYFVGLKQLPRNKAVGVCAKEGYTLVDFNTGLSNNQMLYDLLQKWIKAQTMFPRTAFWTGGKIAQVDRTGNRETVPKYHFESTGKLLKDLSDWPSLEWDLGEPSDSSGIGLDQCISAILYLDYSPSSTNTFSLATTNCRLPHYPLCYKDKVSMPLEKSEPVEMLEGRSVDMDKEEAARPYCPMDSIDLDLTTDRLSYEELLQLSLLSRANAIDSDLFRFKYKQDRPWLANFIDVMFKTGRKVPPVDLVPIEFANIIHNMIILYYNAKNDELREPTKEVLAKIENQTALLQSCMEGVRTLKFETFGGLPRSFMNSDVDFATETVEKNGLTLDLIVDSFWFYFQIAIGICYDDVPSSKTEWLFGIHQIFVQYFLNPFQDRWVSPTSLDPRDRVDYGVFMGDLDLDATFYSLRVASVAAYIDSSIGELYFPRPIYVPTSNDIQDVLNVKTST